MRIFPKDFGDDLLSTKPAFQLSSHSQRGTVPAISAAYAGDATSAIQAATDSMASAEPALYADYDNAVASAV